MRKKLEAVVSKYYTELTANGGIVPASWDSLFDIIKVILEMAELFLPATFDTIINEIIAAINIAENNK